MSSGWSVAAVCYVYCRPPTSHRAEPLQQLVLRTAMAMLMFCVCRRDGVRRACAGCGAGHGGRAAAGGGGARGRAAPRRAAGPRRRPQRRRRDLVSYAARRSARCGIRRFVVSNKKTLLSLHTGRATTELYAARGPRRSWPAMEADICRRSRPARLGARRTHGRVPFVFFTGDGNGRRTRQTAPGRGRRQRSLDEIENSNLNATFVLRSQLRSTSLACADLRRNRNSPERGGIIKKLVRGTGRRGRRRGRLRGHPSISAATSEVDVELEDVLGILPVQTDQDFSQSDFTVQTLPSLSMCEEQHEQLEKPKPEYEGSKSSHSDSDELQKTEFDLTDPGNWPGRKK
ncbi:hypothetical protein EVAR_16992_1 [Eumeta japonica]|uniref:Uncharacterized protein n=1 Tax=Eumeta variegata TaxID=151549 RepID=A0A4C1TWL8_EUMVA|nr:hypothetical protein EVAR_16992_1 [Eumeta japonica]